MQSSLISCIVPVFNGEPYLSETLDSILAQSYRPLEIIVADDGSTDRTANVVANYGDTIRYLKQENAGPPAARNLGLSSARGEFIAFLDADDLWHPDKLARQKARFDAQPALDGSIAYVQNFWRPEPAQEALHYRDRFLSKPVPGYLCAALLARRAVFERVGGSGAQPL
jgi:glycosyltransferase involved in cell wall biosynthesis